LLGGTISAIYYFKPQTAIVSTVFLAVITYMLGELMSIALPRKGIIGRWLNQHPFNVKEHSAIVIMANSASISVLGIEISAVEQLFYGAKLGGAISVFLMLSSQFLGYGIAGLMRRVLVYPKKHVVAIELTSRVYAGNTSQAKRGDEEAIESLLDRRMYLRLGDCPRVNLPAFDR
jgi:hypothetical protein